MMGRARIDLHVHSRHSPDGRASVEQLVDRAASLGLSGMALTDHNSVEGHAELRIAQRSYPRMLLIPGVEISTREGHLLAYGVDEAPPPGRPIHETLEWVRSQAGHAILAHPFRWSHGVGLAVTRRVDVEAIETLNAHNSAVANAKAGFVAARRHLGMTAGSDAHAEGEVGLAYTEFPEGPNSTEELWSQVRRGACVAAGETLSRGGRLALAFRTAFLRAGRGFRPI
jgi:predicted metal-dependent phosphoesterase TrpH